MTRSIYQRWRKRLALLRATLFDKLLILQPGSDRRLASEGKPAAETSRSTTGASLPTIGRYEIRSELGQRGSTMVYLAHDPELARAVAIRALLPTFSVTNDFREQFRREIELIAALEHPSIVKVYDFGEHEDLPYVVMPYLAGGTLERRLAEKPYHLSQLAPIIRQIADALDQAHRQGVVHGQINPGNILFDEHDQAYLSDFGITQFAGATLDVTDQDATQLQLNYISPEQALSLKEDSPIAADKSSDIYSLGVTIFEALTGQKPYQADNAYEAALARLTGPLPQLRTFKPDLPAKHQAIIDRAMAANPTDRYETAGHLARHAEEIASGRWYFEQIVARLPSRSTPKVVDPPPDPAPLPLPEASITAERMIGRYQIQQQLGRGAMGVVYLGYDPQTNRQVAIKVLPQVYSFAPEFRQNFQREAEFVAQLNHEAIVSIYDFGEHDYQPFIVMQYLPGGTLADRLAQKQLKLRQIVKIIERVAAALDEAHRRQIIHQDVKPLNIMFNTAGEAFLSDFGIATIMEQAGVSHEEKAQIGGTPVYMSPEQAAAILNETTYQHDRRSDVYALGVVFFEALTGRVPYQSEKSYGTLLAHMTKPIPRLSEISPELPPECQEVIGRVLAKDPAERYPSAGEFARDVAELASGRRLLRRLSDKLEGLE